MNNNDNNFVELNNSLFFVADFNSNGNELWKLTAANLSTSQFNSENEIKVYPNPAKGIINIDLVSDSFGESTFVMYDVQGRQVINKKSSNVIEVLNIENLSEGIYMLTIENDLGKTTRKIVVNK